MQRARRPLHAADAAPALAWEYAIWWLYQRVETQWRSGYDGRISLDYTPAIAIIRDLQWPVARSLELLQVIERGYLEAQND